MCYNKAMFTVSVAMAAYNGGKNIRRQIDSILPQLKENDELVISLNPSTDNTEEIIRSYQDERIRLFYCEEKGILANFENAIAHTEKDIIFLSDQDDIWHLDKIGTVLNRFQDESITAVCHKRHMVDQDLNAIDDPLMEKQKERCITPSEILKQNMVQGSCLAFRNSLKAMILPIPRSLPMHDSWIGYLASSSGKLLFIEDELIDYVRHEDNASPLTHQKLSKAVRDRVTLYREAKKRLKQKH